MKYSIVQTLPYPSATFKICEGNNAIGSAIELHEEKMWRGKFKLCKFQLDFLDEHFQIAYDANSHSVVGMFKELFGLQRMKKNPYCLLQNGKVFGELFIYDNYSMRIDGCRYTMATIGFGANGIKCPIFEGEFDKGCPTGKQIALIEVPNLGKLLDTYQIVALGKREGLIAACFCIYFDNSCFYKSKTYYKKIYFETYGAKTYLYDPSFKEQVID